MIHVVRHAHARARARWAADDACRPLSATGTRQAAALADRLEARGVTALMTSPALRCRATLEPLAARLGLALVEADFLAEGSSGRACLDGLLAAAPGTGALVACTHGDVILALLELLEEDGVPLTGAPAVPKGGTWELTLSAGRVSDARLRPPPTL